MFELIFFFKCKWRHRHCSELRSLESIHACRRTTEHYSDIAWTPWYLNMLRLGQNGHHFADDTFKRIFLNENAKIWIKISLKFVPKGPSNNIPALVHLMAWRRLGENGMTRAFHIILHCSTKISLNYIYNLLKRELQKSPKCTSKYA